MVKFPKDWSEEWKSILLNIEKLKLTKEISNYLHNLSALLYLSELFTEEINIKQKKILKKKRSPEEKAKEFNKNGSIRTIGKYFLSHQYELSFSILELGKLGYGNSSIILVRSLLENLINLSYLWGTKKINNGSFEERMAWIMYINLEIVTLHNKHNDFISYRKNKKDEVVNELLNDENLNLAIKEKKIFENKYSNFKDGNKFFWCQHPQLNIRARCVDDSKLLSNISKQLFLERDCSIAYMVANGITHGSSAILNRYTSKNENELIFGSDFESINIPLKLAINYLTASLFVIGAIFNISEHEISSQLEHCGFTILTE